MTTHISVLLILAGNLEENILITGDDEKDVVKKAEKEFARLSKKHIPNWERMSKEEKDCALDDGYIETEDMDAGVIINWPEVKTVKSKSVRVTPMGVSADDIVDYMKSFYDNIKMLNKKELSLAFDYVENHENCDLKLNDVIDAGIEFVLEQRKEGTVK